MSNNATFSMPYASALVSFVKESNYFEAAADNSPFEIYLEKKHIQPIQM